MDLVTYLTYSQKIHKMVAKYQRANIHPQILVADSQQMMQKESKLSATSAIQCKIRKFFIFYLFYKLHILQIPKSITTGGIENLEKM